MSRSRKQNGTFLLALYALSTFRTARVHIGRIITLNNRWAHGGPEGGLQVILRGNAIYSPMIERPKPGHRLYQSQTISHWIKTDEEGLQNEQYLNLEQSRQNRYQKKKPPALKEPRKNYYKKEQY